MTSKNEPTMVSGAVLPGEMTPLLFQIDKIRKETHDTFTLELKPGDNLAGFHFEPGQFNMLYVFGVGEVPISISGDPSQPERLIHTTRVVGNVTRAMRHLRSEDAIGVRGPFGRPWPVGQAEGCDVVIVGGGIGLAPLRPAINHVMANRKKYGKLVILYGTRTPSDILFRAELEQWSARFDTDVHVTVDRADDTWNADVGVVTKLIPHAPFDPLNTIAFTCGPEVMMRYTAMALQKRGVPEENIYVTMERNMKCAIGLCGHCQFGPRFVCKDGPVFSYSEVRQHINIREL